MAEPLFLKMAVAVAGLLVITLLPVSYYAANAHFEGALEMKRTEAYATGELIRAALEHEMLAEETTLLEELVHEHSAAPSGKRILIVDRLGDVRFTNDPAASDLHLDLESPTCQVCHLLPPAERASSAVVFDNSEIIRTVHPLRNREECHRCHEPDHAINGVVITDTDITALRAGLNADVRSIGFVLALVAVVLLGGIGFLLRHLVLRPLLQVETTARAMGAGDFSGRVLVRGSDAISRLGVAFNGMADSIWGLLAELRHQRQRLENVMNSVDDGLLVLDRTFTVVAVNDSLIRRLSGSREAVLYERCHRLMGDTCECSKSEALESCPARACFQTGEVHKALRIRVAPDGTKRQEEVFASPVFGRDGEVEHVVEVWRDVSERRNQAARMAEVHRLASLGMLASGFSHEINTPLGTVLLCAESIGERARGPGVNGGATEIATQADLIRKEIRRCRGITQQFLNLSRGESLAQDLVEISSVVESTVVLAKQAGAEAGVTVRVVGSPRKPVVMANAGAVQQVLLNLTLNAVQASTPGGEARLSWTENGEVVVRIEDDGTGMAPEVRERVFEPFFSRRPAGTGLGLFVSLNLARHWGGDIRVSSEDGRGSVFEVVFPRSRPS